MKKACVFIFVCSAAIVFAGPIRAENYDLKAESLVMNSAKCEVNQLCPFAARVKNLGSEFKMDFPLNYKAAANDFKLDSPASLSPARGTTIKTNDYATYAFYGVFSQLGVHTVNFSVDAAGYLSESDVGNNSVSLEVGVTGYDLAVESLTILPAKPMAKQNCYIQIKVKNNSSYKLYTEAGLSLVKSFPDFSVANASSTSPSLAKVIDSGGYLYYGYEGKFTAAGEKQLSFTVDPDDVLKESDSTNNSQNLKITVYNPADADLAVDSVSLSSGKIILGEPLDITVNVKNAGRASLTDGTGLAKAEFSYNLPHFDYDVNSPAAGSLPVMASPFNPGDFFSYKFHGVFSRPGNFNLDFLINKSRQLIEADYGNNATTTPVTVYNSLADADSFSVLTKSVSFASSTAAIISWTTDVKTAGRVNYNLAHNNVNDNKAEAANSALEHAVTLNNLIAGENYDYSITAQNGTVVKTEVISSFTMPLDNTFLIAKQAGSEIKAEPAAVATGTAAAAVTAGKAIAAASLAAVDDGLYNKLKGKIFLKVEDLGQAYYASPKEKKIYYLGRPADAFQVIREQGIGASNADLAKIPLGLEILSGADADHDGLPDAFEDAIGTDKSKTDTDGDGYKDKEELASGHSPLVKGARINHDLKFSAAQKGRIFLQAQGRGEAWYINPADGQRYFLSRPADAFNLMRGLGVGLANKDWQTLAGGK